MSTRSAPPGRLGDPTSTLARELSVVVLLGATAVGFVRVFEDAAVLRPLLVAVLAAEAIAMVGRRLRLPGAVTAVVSVAALVLVLTHRAAPDTTSRFLPTAETWPALRQLAADAIEAFGEMRAPVPSVEPLVLAAFVGLWLATAMTDWGIVRLRLAVEPLLPAAGLFLLCSVLGSGRYRVASTVAFAAAVLLHAVVHRIVNRVRPAVWLPVERGRGVRSVALGGVAMGAVAVLAGVALGPRLPGAGSEELWSWRAGGHGARVVVSPFVTIEARLAEQADVELFRVTADEPAYWRTAGLDVYDDGVWQVRGNFSRESGDLPGRGPAGGTVTTVLQTFTLSALSEIWLPAAYAPARIVDAEGPVTWNEATSTLSVDRDRTEGDGAVYTVESAVPRYTVDELRAASDVVPDEVAEDFLSLPDDVPPVALATAVQVTAGQPTRYDQLRALQDWFLTEFRYETALPSREGDPIEQFLDERAGFCQQFAGTFAVMARALGAPARVAVGFTWGDPAKDAPGSYVVNGRHAHAWPEVWFDGLGWVPFEPTPGRGAPGSEAWTGRPPQQDGVVVDDAVAAPAPASGVLPGPEAALEGLVTPESLGGLGVQGPDGTAGPTGDDGGRDGVGGRFPVPVVVVGIVLVGWLAGVPVIDGLLGWRRRTGARTPAERVDLAWRSLGSELDLVALRRQPSETRLEFARRIGGNRRLGPTDGPLRLAQLATTARYHPAGVDDDAVAEAEAEARRVTDAIHQRVPAWRRYVWRIDPRRRLGLG